MAQDAFINKWNINGDIYDIQDAGRGLPSGVATLDSNGRIPYEQLPESAIEFKGYWNADTNTPTLYDGVGTKGDMYYVDVAGMQDLGSGTQFFNVGDRVLYDGFIWKNMSADVTDAVTDGDMRPVTSNAVYDALKNKEDTPVGLVAPYFGTTDPADGRWLICDGRDTTGTSIELQTHYPSLYTFLGGTNVLPDLRNRTFMGANNDSALGNISNVGDVQNAQLPKIIGYINHIQSERSYSDNNASGAFTVTNYSGLSDSGSGNDRAFRMYLDSSNNEASSDHLGNNVYTTDGETRPANIRCNWIIKAVSGTDSYVPSSSEMQQITQQIDNSVALIKNQIIQAQSYSTTEQLTGGTWIDGKPIYRRVFKDLSIGGTTTTWTNTGVTIADAEYLISSRALKISANENPNFCNFRINSGNLQYYVHHAWSGIDTVIIEYTKTTD